MSSRTLRAEISLAGSRTPAEVKVRDLLDQQAALRELAVAVAELRAPEVIYELVAKEAAGVAGVDSGAVVRFRVDGVAEVVGSWRMGSRQTGSLVPLDSTAGVAIVARTGRPVRTNGSEPSSAHEASALKPARSEPTACSACRP